MTLLLLELLRGDALSAFAASAIVPRLPPALPRERPLPLARGSLLDRVA